MVMTPAQCRAARALLDFTAPDLARKSAVSVSTISKFENGREIRPIFLSALQSHLEAEGVQFIEHGVKLVYIPGIA
jgi:transcriptional regulator with XRE-family HTH domain